MLAFKYFKSSLINVNRSSSSKIFKKFSITKFYKSSIKLMSALVKFILDLLSSPEKKYTRYNKSLHVHAQIS